MLDGIVWLASWILILIGSAFVVSGAVGLIRMPDIYTRLHASSLTDTGGAIFISLGLMLQAVFTYESFIVAIKLVLVLFFTLFTSPTASHALAKTALLAGVIPKDENGNDLVESAKVASSLARSRPEDYQSGQDAKKIDRELAEFERQAGASGSSNKSTSGDHRGKR